MTEMDMYEAATEALPEGSTVEQVEEVVAMVQNLQAIGMLDNETLARIIVGTGKEVWKSLDILFDLMRPEFEKQEPQRTAPPSLSARSIEDIMDGEKEISLEDIQEQGFHASFSKGPCCNGKITTCRKDRMIEDAWCADCHVRLSKSELTALQATDLQRRIDVLTEHLRERNANLGFDFNDYSALHGRSIEEILDGGKSLEEIAGETS